MEEDITWSSNFSSNIFARGTTFRFFFPQRLARLVYCNSKVVKDAKMKINYNEMHLLMLLVHCANPTK